MKCRVLAVDPGEKRLGIALSDPIGILASPLTVIKHVQMSEDCRKIVDLALEYNVGLIIIGQALGADGEETRQSRHAQKLADQIKTMSLIPIQLWDESGSTQIARQMRMDAGIRRNNRVGHMDDRAAAVILQTFLDDKSGQEQE